MKKLMATLLVAAMAVGVFATVASADVVPPTPAGATTVTSS